MTRSDFFSKVIARLRAAWPHSQMSDPTAALIFDTVKDLDVDQTVVAIEALYRDNVQHCPTGGMIRAKVIDLQTDAPDWPAVARAIKASLAFSSRKLVAGRVEPVDERQRRLEREPEIVQRFVGLLGWDEAGQINDPEDRAAEAQLRNKWDQFVRGDKGDRALAGLPSAGLARLERVNSGPRRIGAGVLKQIEGGER